MANARLKRLNRVLRERDRIARNCLSNARFFGADPRSPTMRWAARKLGMELAIAAVDFPPPPPAGLLAARRRPHPC